MGDVVAIGLGGIVIFLIIELCAVGISIASYVMSSLAIHTIGKRRQIRYPWLAWIPVANSWAIGNIAREYDERKGIKRKWNVVLLSMNIAVMALAFLMIVALIVYSVSIAITVAYNQAITEADVIPGAIAFMIVLYTFIIAMIAVATAWTICASICYFKLFESTVPEKALKYFIISLLVPLGMPICLMLCRNKGYPEPEVIWDNTYTK